MLSPVLADRRSPLRPQFCKGWRKAIAAQDALAAPKVETERSIAVWISDVRTLLTSPSNLRVLTDTDRAALLKISSRSSRDSAMAARILLRLSLSLVTNRHLAPSEWCFEQTELGRPYVHARQCREPIDFNVSHTDEIVLVAVGHNVSLGLDVESADQPLEKSLLNAFCHPSETETVQFLAPNLQHRSFIKLWTEKEAYTKMLGLGHSMEFDSFNLMHAKEASTNSPQPLIEGFYIPWGHRLYYATLVVAAPIPQNLNIELVTATLTEQARQSPLPHHWAAA
jgi:phosphopantetheinyl transferase